MTDRLQQKAEQIVRENLQDGDYSDKRLTSELIRGLSMYEGALLGLTAGIAMAAPEELRKQLEVAMEIAQTNIKLSDTEQQFCTAQGAFAAYRHAIALLEADSSVAEAQLGEEQVRVEPLGNIAKAPLTEHMRAVIYAAIVESLIEQDAPENILGWKINEKVEAAIRALAKGETQHG